MWEDTGQSTRGTRPLRKIKQYLKGSLHLSKVSGIGQLARSFFQQCQSSVDPFAHTFNLFHLMEGSVEEKEESVELVSG